MRASDAEIDTLYGLLSQVGLQARDVVKELRREGKKVSSLVELSSFEVHQLIRDCKKNLR